MLVSDPDEIIDTIRDQINKLMMSLTIVRLVGAVERVLKEPLGFTAKDLEEKNWDELSLQVIDGIETIYTNRVDRFIGNGSPGQIASDLDVGLSKLDIVSYKDLTNLIFSLPQGRRAAFDKKTHRRIWLRTNRLTYIFQAANLIEMSDSEKIAADVLTHLEEARRAIRYEWGQSEFQRLNDVRPADLAEDVRLGLENAMDSSTFEQIRSEPFSKITPDDKEVIINELGRQGMTKVYRQLLLSVISNLWVEYLTQLEALRVSIGLEAYAQRDPLVQYKNRAFEMFQNLLRDMRLSVVSRMFTFRASGQSGLQSVVEREVSASSEPKPTTKKEASQPKKKRRRRRRR
jgi:preprotein translocase subunit SecA